jgi:uncharacterized protein
MTGSIQPLSADRTRGAQWPDPLCEVSAVVHEAVPMRDGVELATDLYLPTDVERPLAAILIRTPYDKTPEQEVAHRFAGQGYAVAVQDVRGKFASGGEFSINLNEREDGSDTVDWLAAQDWSNGRVGTYGCSYLGEDQLQLAATQNPHHRAAIAKAAGGVYRYAGLIDGGVVTLGNGLAWLAIHGGGVHDPDAQASTVPPEAYSWLPSAEIVRRLGTDIDDYTGVMTSAPTDEWWTGRGYLRDDDRFSTPVLLVDGWFDYGVSDTLRILELLRGSTADERIRDAHRLIVAPSLHCQAELCTSETVVGDLRAGDASRDYYRLYLRWFDHWLRDGADETLREPRVQLYVMGADAWRCSTEKLVETTLYLRSSGRANTRDGDGRLSQDPPPEEPPDTFTYRPLDPVPSVGGPLFYDIPDSPPGPRDQARVEARDDVLVYTSEPLGQPLEVTGPVRLTVFVASDAPDTDVTAKLVDVAPDGTALNLQDGITRLRYRNGYDEPAPQLAGPDDVVEVTVDLHATSRLFPAGHRIRVQVSSSNFPVYERNLNTGGSNFDEAEPRDTVNRVFHDRAHPSRLVLPVAGPDAAPLRSGRDLDGTDG